MPIIQPAHRQLSTGFVFTLLFLAFLAFRIFVNIESLRMDYTANVFRVGVVPWSDAKAWVDGAVQVINGEPISGVPTARPLYPLFLAVLFFSFGFSYLGIIHVQMILSALVIVTAYYLLKPVSPRVGVWIFICFVVLWRPDVSTIFMTENLGIYLLILGLAFFWRGVSLPCEKAVLAGMFLLGLSQAVRPWCVMMLATVPFLGLISPKPVKKKIRTFILYVLFISMGFSLHPLAAAVFNKPGEGYANNPQTLYGQVVGGKGWTSVYKDPVIKKALQDKKSSQEVNRIIYQRIKTLFWENPLNWGNATIKGYRHYIATIPEEFGSARSNPFYFGIFFIILAFLEPGFNLPMVFQTLKHRKTMTVFLILGIILFYIRYKWFWVLLVSVGLIPVVSDPKNRLHAFILFYFAGIILSIPLVGRDGGMRVMIGNDILLFLTAAVGISWLWRNIGVQPAGSGKAPAPSLSPAKRPLHLWMVVGTVILFLVIPFIIHMGHRPHLKPTKIEDISTDNIVEALRLSEPLLNPEQLNSIWHHWPDPSFETVDGRLAHFTIRYTGQNAVYFDNNQGVTGMDAVNSARHWPLLPLNIRRTLVILERWYTLFPNLPPENLSQFENKTIVVVGRLRTRSRPFRYATPFVLFVSHIISTDDSGERIVTKL